MRKADVRKKFIDIAIENFNLTPVNNQPYQALLNNCPVFIQSERPIMRFTVLGDLFECAKINKDVYIIIFFWDDWTEYIDIDLKDIKCIKIPKKDWQLLFDENIKYMLQELLDFKQNYLELNIDEYLNKTYTLKEKWKQVSNTIEYKQRRERHGLSFACAIRNNVLFNYLIPTYQLKIVLENKNENI